MGRHDAKGLQRITGSRLAGSKRGLPNGPDRPGSSTSAVADLQLLLHNRRLLALCAATVVGAFGVYVLLLVVFGKMDDWALFIFAPMITAGVLVGALLDLAYAKAHQD
jgi:hypothetical protein